MSVAPSQIKPPSISSFQLQAIGICLVLNMLDGFDVLIIAFTAPSIGEEWALDATQIGALFSAGLAGMMIGAMLIAPLADRVGRRKVIILCIVVVTIGMFLSAASRNVEVFAFSRLWTGLGIGGMLPSLNTIVSEYASEQRKNFTLSMMHVGYPVGAILGGTIAGIAVPTVGWRAVYLAGAVSTLVMLPIVFLYLGESLDFLLSRRPKDALTKINAILRRMKSPELSSDQFPATGPATALGLRDLLRQYCAPSIALWAAFLLTMSSLYFLVNWTPSVLVSAGMSLEEGISAGVVMNLGAILGMIALGVIATHVHLTTVIQSYAFLASATIVAIGTFEFSMATTMILVGFSGFFVLGANIGLYILGARLYPTTLRTTGVGWAITIGRLGAMAGPFAAGLLIDAGWGRSLLYSAFAGPLLLVSLIMFGLRGHQLNQ